MDGGVLAAPEACVDHLHRAWAGRRAVIVRLGVDPVELREPRSYPGEPWRFEPRFLPPLDRLHFLVWANAYDARRDGGEPTWWWARKAQRLGAGPAPADGDVVLPDGRAAWVDGGPRGPVDGLVPGTVLVHAETVELGRLAPAPPAGADGSVAGLAPDQAAAVSHPSGPARVIAPAGSGKTRVLTERLRHLLVDRGYEREAVLAVAFNKRAQLELEARTTALRPRVRTLNALGLALLGQARGRVPRVLEEREARRLVEDLVPRPRRRVNTDPIGPYLEALSRVRLGLRDPEVVEDERDDVPGLAAAFEPYRRRLAEAGAVDFDEQVYAAVEALLGDGAFRRQAQAGCRHLLVDELQDLTPAHVLLLRLLAAPALDVFGVGDDDQVIYGHAGADPGFLLGFADLFPGAGDHPLEVNYRCPAAVVASVANLLSHNRRRVAKEVRPGPGADPDPSALAVVHHDPEQGAAALVEVVRAWLPAGARPDAEPDLAPGAEPDLAPGAESSLAAGGGPAGVAVLARVNSLLLAPHVALADAGIPIDSVLGPGVLERTGVRAALAYLRIGCNPGDLDRADLAEVYRRPSRGLPRWITKWFRDHLGLEGVAAIAERLDDGKVAAKVGQLAEDLALVARTCATGTTREALAVVRDGVGLGRAMGLLDGSGASEGGSSHLDDLEALEQVAALHPDPAGFEPWLRRLLGRPGRWPPGGPGAGEPGVTLSTIHRVKGQEWDRVAVFGVTAGIVPHRLATDLEEERRVLHVAITRARRQAVVLADATRPSPFLAELEAPAPELPDLPEGPDLAPGPVPTRPRARPGSPRDRTPAAPPEDLTPEGEAAEARLRDWRRQRSKADGVPAYVVLTDRYLRGIAAARPGSLEELRGMAGIGPTKLELYGEDILAVLAGVADGSGPPRR